ncbi:MAG: hypothetical protein IPQ13_01460 [Holophagaceae bacterium]|nr:hypothetical protein [Holophagaceae bacterium]
MPIPVLKLNLAPQPSIWRQQHETLGWSAIAVGALCLAGTLGVWGFRAYQARKAGAQAVLISRDAQTAARKQDRLVEQLKSVDVTKELPRWKLAERIFTERTLPWSRLTAELERSLVQDVRLKAIQKVRGSDQRVALKLKGEARTREAEEKFMDSLRKDDLFLQVILEREAERTGGGVDFEIFLPVVSVPSPYQPFPLPEKAKAVAPMAPVQAKAKTAVPPQPQPAIQAPAQRFGLPVPPPQRPDARPMGRPGRANPTRPRDRQINADGSVRNADGQRSFGGRP